MRGCRRIAWAAVVTVLATGWIVSLASPAAAHTRAQESGNVDSRIHSEPGIPGVSWRLEAGGRTLAVTVSGATEIVVLGYADEPFLRVRPDGVHKNLNSPATYLSARQEAEAVLPPRADPAAAPDWAHVSSRSQYAWHDSRVRWTGPRPSSGDTPVLLDDWTVPVVHDGRTVALSGELWWVPPPAPWRAPVIALLLIALGFLPAVPRGRAAVMRVAALCVGGVAIGNGIHFVDEVFARPVPMIDAATGVSHTLLFVGAGLAGAWWSLRTPHGSPWILAAGSGAVLLHQGLLQIPMLWSSSIATVWPSGLVRIVVALSLAQAVAVGFALTSRRGAERPAAAEPS